MIAEFGVRRGKQGSFFLTHTHTHTHTYTQAEGVPMKTKNGMCLEKLDFFFLTHIHTHTTNTHTHTRTQAEGVPVITEYGVCRGKLGSLIPRLQVRHASAAEMGIYVCACERECVCLCADPWTHTRI